MGKDRQNQQVPFLPRTNRIYGRLPQIEFLQNPPLRCHGNDRKSCGFHIPSFRLSAPPAERFVRKTKKEETTRILNKKKNVSSPPPLLSPLPRDSSEEEKTKRGEASSGGLHCDEELRAVGVGPRVGHGQQALLLTGAEARATGCFSKMATKPRKGLKPRNAESENLLHNVDRSDIPVLVLGLR